MDEGSIDGGWGRRGKNKEMVTKRNGRMERWVEGWMEGGKGGGTDGERGEVGWISLSHCVPRLSGK